ncbi:MAG: MBL fold metallo-hydrolase [Methanobrevibacter sp.]|uniref:MBL fold metallo-hydrolase n=1 Tax=Methanobrevibacter sp. TaxID=66852 RepID=UPI0025E3FA00|nr:MBL fold metallo-hydrolase [Methanobrevibacter sp.]MBR3112671.1 MBL fold metallo-hydrolase [Methanobrevibacter sp.]
MKITFLGSGGGRFSAISQRRMTGGFRIDNLGGKNYHVDPGPGALIRTYQFGFDPRNLSGIFVSHAHTDHYNDAEILIESMTRGMTKYNGTVFGSRSVLKGFEKWGPCISSYHQSKSDTVVLEPGVVKEVDNIKVKGTEIEHGDPAGIGFQIDYNGFKVSYTSDTGYFEGLGEAHKGADILIASVLRPGNKSIPGHMCSRNFMDLIEEVQPKVAVMTHLGLKMISNNPVVEAKKISKQTGVKTIAAFDGLSFNVNYNNPKKFRLISLKDVESSMHSTSHALFNSGRRNSYQTSFKNKEFDELSILKKS